MSKYSVKESQKRSINILWNKAKRAKKPLAERGYVIHDLIERDSILFVGINPSFNSKKSKGENIFLNLNADGSHPNGRVHQYFKKFPEISSYAGINWSHLDLLMIRETKQAKVKKIYETEKKYILTQLGIAKKSILESKPRVIVVCNAFACSLFERHLFKLRFDETIGTYVVSNKRLRGTPVFFSGMLSGQRALDLGSLRRLKWHIKKIVQG